MRSPARPEDSRSAPTRRALIAAGVLGLTGSAALAASRGSQSFFRRTGLPLGLQLYTVGEQAKTDLDGTLAALSAIGYRTVELAGYIGRTPAELRAALDRARLACASAHIGGRPLRPGPSLQDDPGKLAGEAHTLGFDTIIMPLFNIPERFDVTPRPGESLAAMLARIGAGLTVDDWKANADYLNVKAAALGKHGIRLGYHNHNIEFRPVGGRTGMDILLRETDPKLVSFQLDAGWVVAAGADPRALLAAHPGRFTAMHVKDVKATTRPNFDVQQDPIEVGQGVIDWRRLLPAAYGAGIRRFFVEQEPPFTHPPLESVETSFDYLQSLKA